MDRENLDYEKLKLKAGLEIHQQLDTHKLFCNCTSILRSDEPDLIINRKLHAVAGEKGEVDVAAQYQKSLGKEFIYQFYKDNNCLVEIDEEPPHNINQESLNIALQISILLNCKIFPIAQIMRKTVIDGSNTSGFQRTVLIARDGFIETAFGKVRIETVCLEEDSARKISENNEKVTYRLDRLGIPLIEIATAPDIKSPEQAKEAALHIGEILRSCKVKRGIGTIRQDVNLSIYGGNRVELKGVQDMKMFVKIIDNEILRQKKLSDSKKPTKTEVRNVLSDGLSEFIRPMPGSDRMYPETDISLLKISRNFVNEIKKDLPKLKAENEEELRKKGLTDELIKLVLDGHLDNFKFLLEVYPQDPQLVAKMLTIWRSELATKLKKDFRVIEEIINIDQLEKLLEEVNKEKINKNELRSIFSDLMEGISLKEIIAKKIESSENIEEKIMKLIKEKPGLSENAYMGLVMKKFAGRINGKEVIEIIKKFI